jgi:hypothetical protein
LKASTEPALGISLLGGKISFSLPKATLFAYKMRCISGSWADLANLPAAEFCSGTAGEFRMGSALADSYKNDH